MGRFLGDFYGARRQIAVEEGKSGFVGLIIECLPLIRRPPHLLGDTFPPRGRLPEETALFFYNIEKQIIGCRGDEGLL